MEEKKQKFMGNKMFTTKKEDPSLPKPEGKLSKRMKRMEQSLKELEEMVKIIKSRLGL